MENESQEVIYVQDKLKKEGEKTKIIYDIIHGNIEIDSQMLKVVDDQSFQRLKYVCQMTANHLYPSANHTRFEHSLGVMKLADTFFQRLKDDLKKLLNKDNKKHLEKLYDLEMHLKYGALLHDVGHPPLSHLGETLYNVKRIEENLEAYGIELQSVINGSEHEKMSCLVIVKNLKGKMDQAHKFDYDFICRIITGSLYGDKSNWDKDLIISIVNSKTIDVDKLDYLLRDNYMTGEVGPKIDIKRLLGSLTISKDKELTFNKVGLSAIQKIIDCRDSIYLWVCNHHTVVYTDYIYKECLKHFNNIYHMATAPKYINMDRYRKLCTEKNIPSNKTIKNMYKQRNGRYILKQNLQSQEKDLILKELKEVGYLPYPEGLNSDELFSCEAITEKMVTDNEALYYIRRAMNLSKDNLASIYSGVLVKQLFDRNFLKPTWKTLFEFSEFMKKFDDSQKDAVINVITNGTKNTSKEKSAEEIRRNIVNILLDRTDSNPGEIFLVVRPNNFYQEKLSKLFIYLDERNTKIEKLLPQRDYKKLYNDVAFYIFCEEEKMQDVKDEFCKIFTESLLDFK